MCVLLQHVTRETATKALYDQPDCQVTARQYLETLKTLRAVVASAAPSSAPSAAPPMVMQRLPDGTAV
jgi:hypothetical protein